jgi:hypothetical protein
MQQFGTEGIGEAADRELGAAIRRLKGDGPVGKRRADLHDRAPVSGNHALQCRHRAVDGSQVGDLCRPPELLDGDLGERSEDGGHGIVDPYVDRPESLFDGIRCCFDLLGAGDIGRYDESLSTACFHLGRRRVQPRLTACQKTDAGSASSEGMGGRAAHPRGCSGDDNDLFCLSTLHRRSLRWGFRLLLD